MSSDVRYTPDDEAHAKHSTQRKFRLGLIVNPYAGIGGALALKGSDTKEIREKALAAGAPRLAMQKVTTALSEIVPHASNVVVYTANGDMGENLARDLGFKVELVLNTPSQTEAEDSMALATELLAHEVDIILFAGGDGTARNIQSVIGQSIPVLGVPAGCKIHSGVYAITPRAAGKVLAQVINGELVSLFDAEVKDLNEEAFRNGQVIARFYGEMQVPAELNYIQAVKMGGKESDELVLNDIAAYIIEIMEDNPDMYFVMGSGSTVDAIMQALGLENTLLGVDLVQNMRLVGKDLSAAELLNMTQNKAIGLVITLIGGQGHIFGRGNQQLSPELIKRVDKSHLHIVATKNKLNSLGQKGLICDTPDETFNQWMSGPISVITGYKDKVLYFVRSEQE